MVSLGQASFAPPSVRCCDLSSEGETLVPSLRNLGAVTGVPFSIWSPPNPAALQGSPAPGQVGDELLQQVS